MWDADSGELVSKLSGYSGVAMGVAFSPDGGRIAAAGTDGTIRLWSATTGKSASTPLLGHTDAVRQLAFSRDGARLVSGSFDNTVRVWSMARDPGTGHATAWHTSHSIRPAIASPRRTEMARQHVEQRQRSIGARAARALRRHVVGGIQPGRTSAGQRRRRRHDPNLNADTGEPIGPH